MKRQLALIERTELFSRSANLRKLLRFVVEEELNGRGSELSGKRIGVDLFQRSARQLTEQDSLVRVEMARLRRSLATYYQQYPNQLRIDIPKGNYQPIFLAGDDNVSKASAAGIGVVSVPLQHPAGEEEAFLADAVSSEVQMSLARFGELRVINGSGLDPHNLAAILERCRTEFNCDYLLYGSLLVFSPRPTIRYELLSVATQEAVWGDTITVERELAEFYEIAMAVAAEVVQQIAKPAGVILTTPLFEATAKPPDRREGIDCVMLWHQYRLDQRGPLTYHALYAKLKSALKTDPNFAMGWAMYAYLTLDQYVYRLEAPEHYAEILQTARNQAERSISLDDSNPTAYYVLGLCYYFNDEVEAFRDALYQGLEICPNSVDLLHHGGTLLFLGGYREEGRALFREANMAYHTSLGYRFCYVLEALLHGDSQSAGELLTGVEATSGWYLGRILQALVDAGLGKIPSAMQELRHAYLAAPSLLDDERAEVAKWIRDPSYQKRFYQDWMDLRALMTQN